jgi:outer membrane protein
MRRVVLLIAGLLMVTIAKAQAPPPAAPLSLKAAQDLALKNHPLVAAAQNEAAAVGQMVTASRAAYYPQINADLTASQGNNYSRIGAGALVTSRLFDRFGQGLTLSQLITDSGRTPNLVASSKLQAQASTQLYTATRYDVLIAVDRAYFDTLRALATVKVAEETVKARQLLFDQVSALARHSLKSDLDVSFADVNVSDAKLLLIRAQEALQQAYAELAQALGSDQVVPYQLADESLPPAPPASAADLVTQAMGNRPEIASLMSSRDAAYKFADAEKDLKRPTVSLVGVAGFLPLLSPNPAGPTAIPAEYEGVAINVDFPVFNGHLFSAREEAARQRAMASDQRLRDARDRVARDVRLALASASTAYQRLDVTKQYIKEANLAMELSQGRYNLGLASIIELTQSQLNLTRAEIEDLNAKYDYQTEYAALQYAMGLLR